MQPELLSFSSGLTIALRKRLGIYAINRLRNLLHLGSYLNKRNLRGSCLKSLDCSQLSEGRLELCLRPQAWVGLCHHLISSDANSNKHTRKRLGVLFLLVVSEVPGNRYRVCVSAVTTRDAGAWTQMAAALRWSQRIHALVVRRGQLHHTSIWLATLGGAHSALGFKHPSHAARAGQYAMQQMQLALWMGDEHLARQCLLFTAYALMQLGQLSQARRVIIHVWRYAKTARAGDKLQGPCRAAWRRLQAQSVLAKVT